jgi:hypothetical protein
MKINVINKIISILTSKQTWIDSRKTKFLTLKLGLEQKLFESMQIFLFLKG